MNRFYFTKLIAALALLGGAGCQSNGIPLSETAGYASAKRLGIPKEKWGISRVESTSGGTSRCIPTGTIAVLLTGEVYCRSQGDEGEDCPEPELYAGKIDAARAKALLQQAHDEFDASKDGGDDCVGAFGGFDIYDREAGRLYELSTGCASEEPMPKSDALLRQIWKEQCKPAKL